jgi:hypothetical protein
MTASPESTALARPTEMQAQALESVLLGGDLARMSAGDRTAYMLRVCETLGLNPLTKPFEFITLNGKLVMYARKDCTEQLRKKHGVSLTIAAREVTEDCYIVTARAQDASGRHDESIGAVPLGTLKGEARANAMMKAETKAKRRVTLSICGLGMLDETEVESIPGSPVYTPPEKAGADPKAPSGAGIALSSVALAATDVRTGDAPPAKRPAANTIKHDGKKASHAQVALLHVLRSKLGIADCKGDCQEVYREWSKTAGGLVDKARFCEYHTRLHAFKDQEGKPIESSKDLCPAQISHFIGYYEAKLAKRESDTAQIRQQHGDPPVDMVELAAQIASKGIGEDDLCGFFGKDSITKLDRTEAGHALALVLAWDTEQWESTRDRVRDAIEARR